MEPITPATPEVPVVPPARDGTLSGGTAVLIQLFILAAAGISAYLLSVSLTGGTVAGCGPTSSCEEVLHSNWAYVLGIPVSALALVLDATLLITTFLCDAKSTPANRRACWKILLPGAFALLVAAAWFVGIQALVLHHFCPWCMTAHVCGSLSALLLLKRAPVGHALAENVPGFPRSTVVAFAITALLAIAALGVVQNFVPQKMFSVTKISPTMDNSSTNITAAQVQPIQTNILSAKIVHPFPVLDGRIVLDLDKVPIWGSPSAPLKLVSFYDYTCPHCRAMHTRLSGLQLIVGERLAIISLPMPSDCACNHFFKTTRPEQINACTFARMGLAVWRAKPEAIQQFDDWMFSFSAPPSPEDVTNKVNELVGSAAFEAASHDPWIDQQLQVDTELYGISLKEYGNIKMPQFIIGDEIVTGVLSIDDMRALLVKHDTQ